MDFYSVPKKQFYTYFNFKYNSNRTSEICFTLKNTLVSNKCIYIKKKFYVCFNLKCNSNRTSESKICFILRKNLNDFSWLLFWTKILSLTFCRFFISDSLWVQKCICFSLCCCSCLSSFQSEDKVLCWCQFQQFCYCYSWICCCEQRWQKSKSLKQFWFGVYDSCSWRN